MKKDLKKIVVLLVVLIALTLGLTWSFKAQFVPEINGFVKSNFFWISVIMFGIYLLVLFWMLRKNVLLKISIVLIICFVLFKSFFDAMFFTHYRQHIITDFGNKTYLVSTTNPGFIVCRTQFSIIKTRLISAKSVYEIGCTDYKINRLGADSIQIIVTIKPLFISEPNHYDTVIIKI